MEVSCWENHRTKWVILRQAMIAMMTPHGVSLGNSAGAFGSFGPEFPSPGAAPLCFDVPSGNLT